jgi:hypothetical protein
LNFTDLKEAKVDFVKIDARIDGIDMEQPTETQLSNFDEISDKAFKMLKTRLKSRLKGVSI